MVQHNEVESSVCNLARVFGIFFSVLYQFDDYSIRKFLQTQIFFFLADNSIAHQYELLAYLTIYIIHESMNGGFTIYV